MRKNKIEGAIKGTGRKKDTTQRIFLNVRITEEANEALKNVPRMQRGAYISQLILNASTNTEDLL